MKWQTVNQLASDHGLELYTPLRGKHKRMQIINPATKKHWWTENKAASTHQSLLAIIQQEQLKKLSDEQAIAAAEQAKSFLTDRDRELLAV